MSKPEHSNTQLPLGRAFRSGLLVAACLIPLSVLILSFFGAGNIQRIDIFDFGDRPELVCINDELCIIKVNETWYVIADILDPNDIPMRYRLQQSFTTLDQTQEE